MNRGRSLRTRLTASFLVIGFVLAAMCYGGVSLLLSRAAWEPLDAALREEVEGLALVDASDMQPGHESLRLIVAKLAAEKDLGKGKFVAVFGPGGAPLASAGSVPASVDPGGRPGSSFAHDGAALYRLVAARSAVGNTIVIGVEAGHHAATLTRTRWLLAGGGLTLIVAIGVLAWRTTSTVVEEIEALTAELESVEADSITRRMQPRDTVEVARLADALNRLLARLETAVRGLQRFTAEAAHELRTPLAALRAHLDAALARPPSTGDRDALLDASEQTERLGILAESLLTLSAIESTPPASPRPVDLSDIGHEVGEFLDAVAQEQGRPFEVNIDPHAVVAGEPLLLKRLLLNLLGNAFKHTAPGVAVQLAIRNRGDEVVVTVHDDGRGIDDGAREALFERFSPARTPRNGAGLGLAICREIVLRHRGTIDIDGDSGGTTATVRLPAAQSA